MTDNQHLNIKDEACFVILNQTILVLHTTFKEDCVNKYEHNFFTLLISILDLLIYIT